MKITTIALALLTLPIAAQAQIPPDAQNIMDGSKACLQGFGDAAAIDAALVGAGWVKGDVVDGAIKYQAPDSTEETYALVSADTGETCKIWSAPIDTYDATEILVFSMMEWADTMADLAAKMEGSTRVKNAYGCEARKLPSGVIISVVSGDDPPVCEGGKGSQVIFSID